MNIRTLYLFNFGIFLQKIFEYICLAIEFHSGMPIHIIFQIKSYTVYSYTYYWHKIEINNVNNAYLFF